MSCLETRRELLIAPNNLSRGTRDHLTECDGCRRYAREQAEFNRKLAQAMRVPAPEHLGPGVIFERSTRSRSRTQRWLAVAAAAVLMIAGAATVVLNLGPFGNAMADSLVAHMSHDPIHEASPWDNAADALNDANRRAGLQLASFPGEPIAARICDVGEHKASHFVIETAGVRATAFLMPGSFSSSDEYVEVDGRRGRLVSTPEGMIAVFCPEKQVLDRVALSLQESVDWGGV